MNFEKTVCLPNPSYLLISLPSYFTTTPKNLWTQNEIFFTLHVPLFTKMLFSLIFLCRQRSKVMALAAVSYFRFRVITLEGMHQFHLNFTEGSIIIKYRSSQKGGNPPNFD